MDENVHENVNKKVSLLTILLEQSKLNSSDDRGNSMNYDEDDQLSLTIYLPNGDSITVFVPETSIVQDVIRKTLQSHQKKKLIPALEYTKPSMYELRIHEGMRQLLYIIPINIISIHNYYLLTLRGRRTGSRLPRVGVEEVSIRLQSG
jgi:hypothetical protein